MAERRSQVGCLNAKSVGERLGCKLQQGDITLHIILYHTFLKALLKLFPLLFDWLLNLSLLLKYILCPTDHLQIYQPLATSFEN